MDARFDYCRTFRDGSFDRNVWCEISEFGLFQKFDFLFSNIPKWFHEEVKRSINTIKCEYQLTKYPILQRKLWDESVMVK